MSEVFRSCVSVVVKGLVCEFVGILFCFFFFFSSVFFCFFFLFFFLFQAEDGIRDLVRSRGLGDVYKRQLFDGIPLGDVSVSMTINSPAAVVWAMYLVVAEKQGVDWTCLLYTSDAADERSSVDLGGRRIIKKKNKNRAEDGKVEP